MTNFLGFSAADGDANPAREEVPDQSRSPRDSRGDQEGEPRDEERTEQQQHAQKPHDVSMFSTLTELLLNPFLDGYCKTPFCSDSEYFPPSCPSAGYYYSSAEHNAPDYYSNITTPTRQRPYDGSQDYGEISKCSSGASTSLTNGRRGRRHRPLALAVGYGDEWKDAEGRRVVITPSSSRSSGRVPPSASRTHHVGHHFSVGCTCAPPNSMLSMSPEHHSSNNNRDLSPHQTKSVMCKHCSNQMNQNMLEVPASRSSGSLSGIVHPPPLT